MSEALSIVPGGSPEEKLINPDILELQKKLEKLGFSTISPDVLTRISRSPETKISFSADIDAISSKQPVNENEKSFFETKYIKGQEHGQTNSITLKDGRKLSFSDIQAEKDPEVKKGILNGMTDAEYEKYDTYLDNVKQVAIKEGEKIDKDTQVAISVGENADKLNQKLEKPIQNIQKIDGVPKTIPDNVRESALKNPPKELQGVDQEKIKNGDYDNILIADYYISHAAEITKDIDPKDQEKFKNSVESMSDVLGRPRPPENLYKTIDGLALGPNREKVKNLGEKLINSGYSKDVIWNPRDRSITFQNKQGDTLVIDTAQIPPIERVVHRGLSLGREIVNISPREKEKKILEKKQTELQSSVIKDSNNTKLATLQEIPVGVSDKNPKEITQHQEAQRSFLEAKNPSEKQSAIEKLKTSNRALDTMRRTTLTTENSGSRENTKLEQEIEQEYTSITLLENSLTKLVNTNTQLDGYRDIQDQPDTFYTDAKKSLKYLSHIAYDELGQGTLEKIIDAINIRNSGKLAEINLSKNPKLDTEQEKELLRVLAQLSRKSGLMTSWQGVNPDDEIIAARQMNSPNWRLSLQDISKSLKFQEMKGSNRDIFTQYIYEQPKTETESPSPTENK